MTPEAKTTIAARRKESATGAKRKAGTYRKRGDSWEVRVFTGRRADGRRLSVTRSVKGDETDAQLALAALISEVKGRNYVEPTKLTLGEYMAKWLATVKSSRRQTTWESYSWINDSYIKPILGDTKLTDVRPLHVQDLYSRLQSERELSGRTVRYTHSILKAAFNQAIKWGEVAANPAAGVTLPRKVDREMRVFGPGEAQGFLAACQPDTCGVALMVALSTGMRPGEYLGLRWADIDLERGEVRVRHSLVWRKGVRCKRLSENRSSDILQEPAWRLTEPKTTKSRRTIPLPAPMVAVLSEHRKRQLEMRLAAGAAWQQHDFVFTMQHGTPVRLRYLDKYHFKPTLKRAGLPAVRAYDLRHSYATLLLAAGVNIKEISTLLGHASIALTLDVYSHLLPGQLETATAKLGHLFAAA